MVYLRHGLKLLKLQEILELNLEVFTHPQTISFTHIKTHIEAWKLTEVLPLRVSTRWFHLSSLPHPEQARVQTTKPAELSDYWSPKLCLCTPCHLPAALEHSI